MPEFKTEPMSEEQFKHIIALLFNSNAIEPSPCLAHDDDYNTYLELCKTTKLKELSNGVS